VIAKVLTERRATWIVFALSVIALALLAPVTGKLKSVQNNDAINYLPRGAQSTQVQQILAELPGGNTADAVVVYARTGGLSGPDIARIAAARTALANGVDLAAPLGPLVESTDHAAALFRVPLSSAADALPDKVARIRSLTIRLDDGVVTLGPGQLYVVLRGVQHQPVSTDGAEVVLIEPSATVNTGDTPSQLTAERRRG